MQGGKEWEKRQPERRSAGQETRQTEQRDSSEGREEREREREKARESGGDEEERGEAGDEDSDEGSAIVTRSHPSYVDNKGHSDHSTWSYIFHPHKQRAVGHVDGSGRCMRGPCTALLCPALHCTA